MPQLNPLNWFNMLTFSWAVLGTIVPAKVKEINWLSHPQSKKTQKPKATPWSWPWS
nr:ATP synthase F0 subunit 8 [Malacanthus brevirostris]